MNFRRYVAKALDQIKSEGLHGSDQECPAGFRRGIDILGDGLLWSVIQSSRVYFRHHGRLPNLIAPSNFTEKQLLFKFYGLIPELSPSDKLRSVFYAPESVRHLFRIPRRIWVSDKPALPGNNVTEPGSYFFKSNHSSGTNLPVEFPVSLERRRELEQKAQHWLTKIHSKKLSLWWYESMERNVYLEEDLRLPNGDAPDWKFFVCNGKVELFQIDRGRFGKHIQTVHERDGTYIPEELFYRSGPPPEMPDCLPDMIQVAEAIGRNFDFIRVDMFVLDGEPYLGEIGLVPNGATLRIRSAVLDERLGDAWNAPWLGKAAPGFHGAHYDNVEVQPVLSPERPVNLAA